MHAARGVAALTAAALTTAALTAATARADDRPIKPDARAVEAAREANLEPESVREGFAIGIALGPSVQLAYGLGSATGGGGGFDLRLGTVASERLIWLVELAATAFPHNGTANQSTVATFGAQLYVQPAFWLRAGGGFASFVRRDTDAAGRYGGLGGLGAAGFDVARRGGLALSAEGAATVGLYRAGTVIGISLQLGLSWY